MTRNLRTVALCVAAGLAVSGCANGFSTSGGTPKADTEMRAFVGKCIVSDKGQQEIGAILAPVLATLAGSAIKHGLNAFGTALRKAGEAETITKTANANIDPQVDFGPCVQVVRGNFSQFRPKLKDKDGNEFVPDWLKQNELPHFLGDGKETETDAEENTTDAKAKTRWSNLYKAGIWLTEEAPEHFLEARMRFDQSCKAIAVGPTYIHYGRFFKGGAKSTRGVVINVALVSPGKKATDNGVPNGQISFGNIKTPYTVRYHDITTGLLGAQPAAGGGGLSGVRAAGQGGAQENQVCTKLKGFAKLPKETAWMSLDGTKLAPTTVSVSIAETRDANKFLLFLADVFDDSKEELEKAAQRVAIASERAKFEKEQQDAAQQAREAQATAAANYYDAYAAAELAIAAYKASEGEEPSVRLPLAVAARKAQDQANLKAAVADLPEPYGANALIKPQSIS